ncbi:DUF2249 domain-containing protein [Devosia sp. YIM 151766]|uniref:DUF2249 domain-containing protein n=1 Tax=Devosia sp. YIM 151766 TaxID=3017325 RepID=UPI00255C7C45|nr:DUF2249 domain-containing protein [Devosia sp. YIM 151766]WIY52365.1 DUF2249 domain-containing protein [Devosia sp. YIM 151766]
MTDLELDVRPILRNGGEPFGAIMGAVNSLLPGQRLKLFATFRPEPLFRVMEAKGFGFEATPLADGDWQVLFTPQAPDLVSGGSTPDNPDSWADPNHYLDLTDLDPPEPMVRILARLEDMDEGEVLFALLAREPLFLFPEIKARGHAWAGDFDASGTAYRLMVRAGRQT